MKVPPKIVVSKYKTQSINKNQFRITRVKNHMLTSYLPVQI